MHTYKQSVYILKIPVYMNNSAYANFNNCILIYQ